MALNRDKFRKIVGGITTATEPQDSRIRRISPPAAADGTPEPTQPPAGQGVEHGDDSGLGRSGKGGGTPPLCQTRKAQRTQGRGCNQAKSVRSKCRCSWTKHHQ